VPVESLRRGDVQGLRAFAVLSVIFYHLHTPGFSGGFVGVDAFFVISGFLVTGMLLREIDEAGSLALLPFFARRARRLLPNAALTLLAVLLLTMALVPRYRLGWVMDDLVSAALFYSNVHFAAQAVDYFTLGQAPSPVLHFWSLSIEGQFYLLLPVLLLVICGFFATGKKSAAGIALALVFLASFTANLVISDQDQTKAFFSLWARCWQFALGGLVNFVRLPAGRRTGEALSALGLAGLALSVGLFDDALAYPGLYALLPTFSAAFVICGGGTAWLLSHPLMQWIGDRSYSLYLWHWPVILFVGEPFAQGHKWALLLLSFVIAEIAYRYVETPLRRGRRPAANASTTLMAGAAAQCLVALAALGAGPLLSSISDPQAEIAELIKSAESDLGRNYDLGCHLAYEAADIPETCVFGDTGADKTVVLFGDSHAAQWFEPLEAAASNNGWRLLAWTKSSCPSADVSVYYVPKKTVFRECDLWRQHVMNQLRVLRPSMVVLSNSSFYSGWVADRKGGKPLSDSDTLGALSAGLRSVALQLSESGAKIAVIADTPRAAPDYRDCLSRKESKACERQREEAIAQPAFETDALAGLKNVEFVNNNDEICGPRLCPLLSAGQLIYRDDHHLAAAYAKSFEPQFAELLRRVR
jgi:peptidoglycan/LPS O-acetylase OafA/YrhL